MRSQLVISIIRLSLLLLMFGIDVFAKVNTVQEDIAYAMSAKFKPEMFFGKNVSLLNNNNETDKLWFSRHTLDVDAHVWYGIERLEVPAVEFTFSIRNKAVWGNAESIARTTEAELKDLEVVGGQHRHAIPRHIFWMREVWLDLDLQEAFGINFRDCSSHFTLGAFPFQLGRGIALGDAFAVGPELLGFYSDSAIDQYAFGAKFSGGLVENKLAYDVYASILNNQSTTLGETTRKIFGQEFERLGMPARGFGHINFLIAGRLLWTIFNNQEMGSLVVEPYVLYNSNPEQKVEFTADASSKLGTVGMAGEYYNDTFEFGFDWAVNIGQQSVRGWDRNTIVRENRNGNVVIVNSHVVDQDGNRAFFIPQHQTLIDASYRNESQNSQEIGIVGDTRLINVSNRFRNPFINSYRGWMIVADAAYWIYKKDLQLAVTAGAASGDDNPNFQTKDGTFDGFISLQELYDGKRVRSAFLLGSAGKVNIPLSVPRTEQAPSRFASTVSRFTNLIFVGGSTTWVPQKLENKLKLNPNILAYWQQHASNKFDAQTQQELDEKARRFLGVEANIFFDYYLLKNLKMFFVGSIFFAGGHFTDVKGIPLTRDQEEQLDRLDRTGFDRDRIPNLGDDNAFTFNIGLEFRF